jgi:hypothetical protein
MKLEFFGLNNKLEDARYIYWNVKTDNQVGNLLLY